MSEDTKRLELTEQDRAALIEQMVNTVEKVIIPNLLSDEIDRRILESMQRIDLQILVDNKVDKVLGADMKVCPFCKRDY